MFQNQVVRLASTLYLLPFLLLFLLLLPFELFPNDGFLKSASVGEDDADADAEGNVERAEEEEDAKWSRERDERAEEAPSGQWCLWCC